MPKIKEVNTDELLEALKKVYVACEKVQEELEVIVKQYDLGIDWCAILMKEKTGG